MSDLREDEVDDSIGALLGRLVDDAETFVKAEIKLYRAEALHRLTDYWKYVIYAAVGCVLGLCAIILLLMAAVFVLAPYIGTAGAALLIAVIAIAVMALLLSVVTRKIRRELNDPGKRP